MSKIAIIDTAIDSKLIGNKAIKSINLCGGETSILDDCGNHEVTHGTLCAMVLNHCASDYELLNIQIFNDNSVKVFGQIELLANALRLCRDLKVDIISLSAVSSILSDSKKILDTTLELSRDSVIVSALDNARYITIPTSYPHVLGVSNDNAGLLKPGEIAFCPDNPFGVNIYANSDFDFLHHYECGPSNSLAVPVVVAFINDLLNRGKTKTEIEIMLQSLKPYPLRNEHIDRDRLPRPARVEIPIVFAVFESTTICSAMMDSLFDQYEVQSSALSFVEGDYDIRIQTVVDIECVESELCFMENHYKTDLIFIIGSENHLNEIKDKIEIDVELIQRSDCKTLFRYDTGDMLVSNFDVVYRLHNLLSE